MRSKFVLAAVLAAFAVPAAAQPPVVEYDGNGQPIHRFEQAPDGGTVQEDWRGRPEGTLKNTPVGPVFQDWRGIPVRQ